MVWLKSERPAIWKQDIKIKNANMQKQLNLVISKQYDIANYAETRVRLQRQLILISEFCDSRDIKVNLNK